MPLDHLPGTFFGPSNLIDLVRHRAAFQPDDAAFIYLVDGEEEQVQLSNKELDRQARAIAAWLESHDLVGQRALLLYPAGLEFIAAFFGCLYAGVTAVPVYPPRRNRSLERIQAIADDAAAKVALTTDAVLRRVEPLIDDTPNLKDIAWLATCRMPEGIDEQWERPDVHGDTMAFLQYTSGSTGTPKGVMLNHANLLHNSALIAHAFEHTRSGTGVFWLPSYHDMGLIGGILQPLYVGRPNVLMSPMSFLQKPFRWLSAITRFGGTTSGGPNFAYDLCVRKITPEQREQLDLSSWEVAFNGAEPVRPDTIESFSKTFAPYGFRREAFYPCFGMAEATLIVSGGFARKPPVIRSFQTEKLAAGEAVPSLHEEEASSPLVGCGGSLPDQKVLIADPDTRTACTDGKVGEVWVRGPSVAQGYWGKPDATQETFHARLADSDEGPFLRTGDLGFMLDGELFVTGRIKDLIIHHGVNVYPQDIERTVQGCHPRLRPDSGAAFTVEVDGREQFVIVHELKRRKKGDLDVVFQAIHRTVSAKHDMGADAILLIKAGSIPKTSSGKIQRHACRDGYLDGSLEVVACWRAGQPLKPAVPLEPPVAAKEAQSTQDPQKPQTPKPPAPAGAVASRRNDDTPAPNPAETDQRPVAEVVLEHVRRVALERAEGLTLDTVITEIGMDSLERMEILASLEEHFGGRFPEEILLDLETGRHLVEAVTTYLGRGSGSGSRQSATAEIPARDYRVDQFPEYVKLRQNLDLLDSTGLGSVYFTVHEDIADDRTTVGGRELINYSSFNYVGMSGEPAVTQAAKEAIERYGTSVSASRLVSGEKPLHGELERAIARFVGTDDAIALVGGHATNETVIGHLLRPGDLVLHDALAHNSIVQGAILSGARRRPFPHNDWEYVDRLLADSRRAHRRVMIVIEGVYSMDGDIPDLPSFIEVKNRHKAMLMIDEAHSIGVLGWHGRGIGEHYDVNPKHVDVWMGTLSKAFGSCGGYIAGSKALVEYLKYSAPGFVFSCGLPPGNAGAALAAIQLLEAQPERAVRLQNRACLFLDLAKRRGLNTGMSKGTPVVPVILGNSMHCLQLSKALALRGINAQPILHPAVEEEAARLRFFLTALHTEEQIRYTIDAMCEELEKIDPNYLAPGNTPRTISPQAVPPT